MAHELEVEDMEPFNGSDAPTPPESLAVIGKRAKEASVNSRKALQVSLDCYHAIEDVRVEMRQGLASLRNTVMMRHHPALVWSVPILLFVMAAAIIVGVVAFIAWTAKGG